MIIDGRDYIVAADDVLLFDTNVLIRLFSPVSQGDCFGYDLILSSAREAGAGLLLSSVQVSEFINRSMRMQFQLYCREMGNNALDYKRDYRQTDDYFEALDGLYEIFKNEIFPYFTCVDDRFSGINLPEVLIPTKEYDFNDKILEYVALNYNAKIVTSDFDFSFFSFEHEIITTLPSLLKLNNLTATF